MKKLKIGIIGVGRLGYEHACNIANRVPGSELVAIADANFDRAKQVAEELGVTAVYNDPKDLCADPNVEAVAIITNTASHVEMIKIAMDAGKHVFCEKPLADTVEKCKEAEAIIAAHPELTFMLGFMRRYDRGYAEMKRIIDSGELGAPLMIHACHRNVSQPDGFQTEMGVSNVAIHELDICRWLLGDEYESAQVLKVRQSACSTKGYDNPQIVLLETKSGARIDVEVQVADAYGYDIQCQVVCEKGTVNLPDPYAVVKRANASRSFPILTDWKDRFIEAYDIELTHWVKTLEEKGEPDGPSAWDGYAACVAADALNRSRGTGRFLPVETMEKPELYR